MQYYLLKNAYCGKEDELKEEYMVNNEDIKLIHIGKCGGTAFLEAFGWKGNNPLYEIHQHNKYKPNLHKYIIWLRNPISRFISAFMYNYNIHHADIDKLPEGVNIYNTICPEVFRGKLKRKRLPNYDKNVTWGNNMDFLISYFNSPNDVAESLTSEDKQRQIYAKELMDMKIEHIHKGIGFYLHNGDFVDKHYNRIIFVGTMENMEEDLIKVGKILGKNPRLDKKPRVNEYNDDYKYLSKKGFENIKNYFEGDYKALKTLNKHKLINNKILESYNNYKYIK